MHYGGYYWWGAGMGIGMIVFWVLVIIAIIVLVRSVRGSTSRHEPKETPLDILKKRYASGEITKEEYDRMREDLKQ